MSIKKFVKEHKGAIIGTTAAVTGTIIGYACGANHLIARLEGYSVGGMLTTNRKFADKLNTFFEHTLGWTASNLNVDVPVNKVVDVVKDSIDNIPSDIKTVNILMTAK